MVTALSLSGAIFLAGLQQSHAATNLITNGDFHLPGTGCAAGTTTLPGWTVVSGNIDIESVACSGIASALGETYFLDLTGSFGSSSENDVGSISQTITTVVGQKYKLTFSFGGNPQWQEFSYPNDSELKVMTVYLNGAISGAYKVNTTGVSVTDGQWKEKEILFTATSTTTTVTFSSLNGSLTNPSDFGPLLGNVVITVVK
jgi:hypothetical protein